MRPKTNQEIEAMHEGGRMLAQVLDMLGRQVAAGMTTKELADIAAVELKKLGGRPAFLDFEGFPDVACVSLNDEVVHGIPSNRRKIKHGDVVSIDFGVVYKSMVVDGAATFFVGDQLPADIKRLLDGTSRALEAGIAAVKGEGARVGDIASAVQNVLEQFKLGIVRDLVGHGVGHSMHEEPNIPNYGVAGTGPTLSRGMTISIEPMATLGDWQVSLLQDGWTVVTSDGSLAAHFEHTILITDNSAEIVTR